MSNIFKQRKRTTPKSASPDLAALFIPWDYPEPIIQQHIDKFLADDKFVDLIYMAKHGRYTAQKAVVHLSIIHPYINFKPGVDDEFKETFDAWHSKHYPMTLTLYEHAGKLIMSNDYEAYWMYRERELEVANCVIVGKYTEDVDIAAYDRPFIIGSDSDSATFHLGLMI